MNSEISSPKVSVVIPAYNCSSFLPATVASVLAQSFDCFEIIIIDDGSLDDTCIVANNLSAKDSRIRFFSQKNGGVSSARNLGYSHSQGEFVAFLDSDDLWQPEFLSNALKAFYLGADVFVAASFRFYHVPGDCADVPKLDDVFVKNFPESLVWYNPIVPAMVVIRRSAVEAVGNFEDDRNAWEDWDYWIRLAECGFRFSFNTTDKLVNYRCTPDSRSSAVAVSHERCAGTLEKHEFTSIAPRRFLRRERANWLRRRGNVDSDPMKARHFYHLSISVYPWHVKSWVKWFLTWFSAHRSREV
jgi:glycosyltransferase involved in cell wall biosynthesis